MTNKKAPAPTGAHGSIAAPSLSTAGEATQFLKLLGKDPAKTWFRTLKPTPGKGAQSNVARRGADLHGFDEAALGADNRAGSAIYFITGDADQATKPTAAVDDADVHTCRAVFVEWDNQPIEWQVQAWRELNLPEPTAMVKTGGKSVHCYWRLLEPMAPEPWRVLQGRLIDYAGGDTACKNPSRLMRLPGFRYIDKTTGKLTANIAELIHQSTSRYTAAEIEACLPALPPPAKPASKPKTKRSVVDLPPRSEADLLEALATRVPAFLPDESRRDELLNLAFRLWVEVGAARAEQILAKHSPAVTDLPSYFKGKAPTKISAGSIWPFLNEHYDVDLERYDLKRSTPTPAEKQQDKPAKAASLQSMIQQLQDGWDPKTLTPQGLSAGRIADMLPAADLRFNEMTLRAEAHTSSGWLRITDADMDSAYVVLSGKGWKVGSEPVIKAIIHTARQAPHHPVKAYLQQVEADPGIAPFDLDQVAPQFFRANQPLHVAMVRKWLIGAVSRALNPGCQMDYVLVLQGAQGQLKSTSLGALASHEWHCSSIPENEKDLLLNIHSTWIYELAELESVTSRKESGRLKNLITTSADLVRVPYGRTSERMARQSVFCATVNEDTFLRDDTGNRRFWVVPVEGAKPIDKAGLLAARDAIWKAAVAAFRAGELPMLTAELEALSSQQNQEFNQQDPWVEMVLAWMDGDPLHRWDPDRDPSTVIYDANRPFTSAEILYSAGLRRLDQITRADEMRVAAVLRQLKFDRAQKRVNGRIDRFWLPSQPSQPQAAEVVTPETRSGANGLGLPSQPSQPISTKRRFKNKEHITTGAGVIPQESFEKSTRGCDTLARSVAPQSFQPSQPTYAEVVTPSNREENEQRIREHGRSTDLTGWSDADVAELLQSLEAAHTRRAAAAGIAIPRAA
ncbi:MAG: Phormidium phage MIS-PhV1B [Cyanobacteriota bacterium]|jgi:predicted P-loop ATPase